MQRTSRERVAPKRHDAGPRLSLARSPHWASARRRRPVLRAAAVHAARTATARGDPAASVAALLALQLARLAGRRGVRAVVRGARRKALPAHTRLLQERRICAAAIGGVGAAAAALRIGALSALGRAFHAAIGFDGHVRERRRARNPGREGRGAIGSIPRLLAALGELRDARMARGVVGRGRLLKSGVERGRVP